MKTPVRLLTACVLLPMLCSCAVVGPASIANGRAAYTDVITRTNDQQLLNMVVRMRYAEPSSLVTVTGITAQSEMSIGAGGQVGVGSSNSYAGNLVPFAVDGHYRETPTISYTPISGERYFKELLTPVELDLFVLLVQAAPNEEWMFRILTASLGRLEAPVYRAPQHGRELTRAITLLGTLARQGSLDLAFRTDDNDRVVGVSMTIHDWSATAPAETRELMALLGRELPRDARLPILLTLQMGRGIPTGDVLPIRTRCPMELLQLASMGVDVPEEHEASGITVSVSEGTAPSFLQVHCGKKAPEDPMVAVQYRGYWFWIDSSDIASKRGFSLLQMLLMRSLEGKISQQPLLSLPIN